MKKKAFSAFIAAAIGGVVLWFNRRPKKTPVVGRTMEDAPLSATSLSAQPHRRQRIARPIQKTKEHTPPPDSAAQGRTPYYFVPGEALIMLSSPDLLDLSFLQQVATHFKGVYLPTGEEDLYYPTGDATEKRWFTVMRLSWPTANGYEETVKHFAQLESQVNQQVKWDQVEVKTWMPNWLGTLAGQAKMYTPGGPASYPRPVEPNLPTIDASFLPAWRQEMSHPVTLAVLDAYPDANALAAEKETPSLPDSLATIVTRLCDRSPSLTLNQSTHYATYQNGQAFDMSDHGLMTTWLATQIVGEEGMKHVTLEPVRVASAYGVCSTADVIAGLAPLARRAHDGETLVILLPFVLGMSHIIPPRLRPYEEHYEALRLLCLSINQAGGTLVGAAGNDASGLQHPPRTRLPASFRSVIDVTAGQLNQTDLALYANQAKALSLFGGEANLQSEIVDHLPSLMGPALSAELRSSDQEVEPNTHGWVAWAGTSFAAALAAGLAVTRRSHDPQLKMWDIRTQLRQQATATRHPGNVSFLDIIRPTE